MCEREVLLIEREHLGLGVDLLPATRRVFIGHSSSDPPIDRVGRREVLNDASGREARVFIKSPCLPRRRNTSPACDDETSSLTK